MNKLFLLMLLFLTGCSDAIKIQPTTPVGKIPQQTIEQTTESLSHNGMWITVWLICVLAALVLVFRTFKKES
tara:strand:- start:827 stop:1042 length:216 start_codon:yes stop_codon:yes gene_type:complete